MLDSLRKSAGSWFAKILLGLLVISFAIWGVGDIFRATAPTQLATVGDRDISPEEFQRNYQNQLTLLSNQLGRQLTSQEARAFGVGQRVLENLIGTTAIDIHAETLGLGLSDEAIAEAIRMEQSFHNAEGAFDPQRLQELLRNIGMSEAGFVTLQRQEMIRAQLAGPLSRGSYVPQTLLEATNRYRNEERVLKYFILPASAAGQIAEPDEATLQAYYNDNKSRYMAPEYRRIGMLTLTPEAIKDAVAVTDEEVRQSYEATKERYGTPERRTIQQLIFKDMNAAREAHEKLKNGADFVQLGKELGMTENDINLGSFAKSGLADRKVAEAAFALQQGQFSEPIDSFSPVIVKVAEIAPGTQKSFEEVQGEVRDALAKSRAGEEIAKLYDAVEDERASGAKVAEAAKKLNLNYAEYTFDRNGRGQDGQPVQAIAEARPVIQLVFDSDVGVENNPVTIGDGFAFVDVLEVIPERQKTFEDVKDQVKTSWMEEETRKRVRAKADELVAKLKSGTPMEQAANEVGAKVETTPALKRDAAPQGLPRTAVSLAFTLSQGGFGAAQMPDRLGQAVIQLAEIKPAPPLSQAGADALRTELRQAMTVDILTQYVGGLQKEYGVSVNNNAISSVLGQ